MTGEKFEGSESRRKPRLTASRADAAVKDAERRLNRLMPFDEWCAAMKPTETAKELYLFVRARLEMRVADALAKARHAARNRARRARERTAQSGEGSPSEEQPQH